MNERLTLRYASNLANSFKSFNVNDIYNLVERFYPRDFTQFEILTLRRQLEYFQIDVLRLAEHQCISSLFELCQQLVEIIKFQIYFLINILIRLVLTLLILTVMT